MRGRGERCCAAQAGARGQAVAAAPLPHLHHCAPLLEHRGCEARDLQLGVARGEGGDGAPYLRGHQVRELQLVAVELAQRGEQRLLLSIRLLEQVAQGGDVLGQEADAAGLQADHFPQAEQRPLPLVGLLERELLHRGCGLPCAQGHRIRSTLPQFPETFKTAQTAGFAQRTEAARFRDLN